jgi:hypothetical protein
MKAEEERFLNLLYDYAYSTRSAEITSLEVDKKLLESLYVLIDTRINLPKQFKLKTLEKHNSERRPNYETLNNPKPNGISCPKCGSELLDTNSAALMSNPPKRSIHCPNPSCDYIGNRIA